MRKATHDTLEAYQCGIIREEGTAHWLRTAKMGSRNAPRQSEIVECKTSNTTLVSEGPVRTQDLHDSFVYRFSLMLTPGSLILFVNYRKMFEETSSQEKCCSAKVRSGSCICIYDLLLLRLRTVSAGY